VDHARTLFSGEDGGTGCALVEAPHFDEFIVGVIESGNVIVRMAAGFDRVGDAASMGPPVEHCV
jgi:hypothetical protein